MRYLVLAGRGSYEPLDDFSDGYTEQAFTEMKSHINKMMIKFTSENRDWYFRDACNSLDFNKMRDDGYVGFYVHQKAINEANSVLKSVTYYDLVNPLKFWGTELMCVWNWCFIDT